MTPVPRNASTIPLVSAARRLNTSVRPIASSAIAYAEASAQHVECIGEQAARLREKARDEAHHEHRRIEDEAIARVRRCSVSRTSRTSHPQSLTIAFPIRTV